VDWKRLEVASCPSPSPSPSLLLLLRMKYIAAYILATLGGNNSPSVEEIKRILSSVGVEGDNASIEAVISGLKGEEVDGIVAADSARLASLGLLNTFSQEELIVIRRGDREGVLQGGQGWRCGGGEGDSQGKSRFGDQF